jgi:transitional endoplasmic reticulum ATPase
MNRLEFEKQLLENPFDLALREEFSFYLLQESEFLDCYTQVEILLKQKVQSRRVCFMAASCLYSLNRLDESRIFLKEGLALEGDEFSKEFSHLEDRINKNQFENPSSLHLVEKEEAEAGEADLLELPKKFGFDDVAGMDELKKTIRLKIIEPFLRPGLFAKFSKKAGGGILLYGPPGCGKTLFARAIAGEINANFISVSASDVLSRFVGGSESAIQEVFEDARMNRPCVIFFDELDGLAFSRSKANSDHTRTIVNELLRQLDGFDTNNEQVMVLAATNMPWDVDGAMKRPGRFSKQVFVPPPTEKARAYMFELKLKDIPKEALDYLKLAKLTQHFSGADIDGVIELAKENVLSDIIQNNVERGIKTSDLLESLEDYHPSTLDWLKTARNLVKFGGIDGQYKEVKKYLSQVKL